MAWSVRHSSSLATPLLQLFYVGPQSSDAPSRQLVTATVCIGPLVHRIDAYPFGSSRLFLLSAFLLAHTCSSWKSIDSLKPSSGVVGSAIVSLRKDSCGNALALYLHVGMSGFSIGLLLCLPNELLRGQGHFYVVREYQVLVLALFMIHDDS